MSNLSVTIDTKELAEELSQLIELLKEASVLIDSITSKNLKDLIEIQDIRQ